MKRWLVIVLLMLVVVGGVDAQDKVLPLPKLSVEVGKATKPEDVSVTLQILFLMTILSLAPAILILTTAFTRIVVVLHFLRQALSTAAGASLAGDHRSGHVPDVFRDGPDLVACEPGGDSALHEQHHHTAAGI